MTPDIWTSINDSVRPIAIWVTDFRNAPVVILATIVVFSLSFLVRQILDSIRSGRQRKMQDDIAELRKMGAEQQEMIAQALGVARELRDPVFAGASGRGDLQRALEDFSISNDARGASIPSLIANRSFEEARTLAFDIAERTDAAAKQMGGAWVDKAIRAWLDAGEVAHLDDPLSAHQAFQRAYELGDRTPTTINALGVALLRLAQIDQAEAKFVEAEDAIGSDDPTLLADVLGNQGLVARTQYRLDEAKHAHTEALKISLQTGDQYRVAQQLANLGLVAMAEFDLARAEQTIKEALSIFEAINNSRGVIVNLNNLCTLYQMRGDSAALEEQLDKLIPLQEAQGDREGLANSLGMRGLLARENGQLVPAETFLRHALDLHRALHNREGVARDLSNLGLLAQSRKDYQAARKFHTEAMQIFSDMGSERDSAGQLGNLALLEYRSGNLDEADRLFSISIGIFERLGDSEGLGIDLLNRGTVASDRGDRASACAYWARAKAIFVEIGHPATPKLIRLMTEKGCA